MSIIYVNPYLFSATDPNFASVSLLLHGDSTPIVDSSPTPKTVTVVGNTQISTAQSPYPGGSSIEFDGIGDYLTLPAGSAFEFGTGDFTVELWFRCTSLTGFKVLIDTRAAGSGSLSQRWIAYTNGTSLIWNFNGTDYSAGTVATNTWYFTTLCRATGSTRIFTDGVQVGSTISDTTNYGMGASRPIIGADGNNTLLANLSGFIDELRITKGVARYTANFSPPTAPFPDS